jgi:hypothetical protein
LLSAVFGWHRERPRLTIEADWGKITLGNLGLTVRNRGPKDARMERLYLMVHSSKLGSRSVQIVGLPYIEKKDIPKWIASGEPAYFNVVLDLLDLRLRVVGYEGRCRITPVVEDGFGNVYKGASVGHDVP